jgi:hypothetical protein
MDWDWPEDVTLDLSTLTLGEMSECEMQSGRSFDQLMKGKATQRMVALFVHGLRHFAPTPSWSDVANLHLSDVRSSTSRSRSDGPRLKSAG